MDVRTLCLGVLTLGDASGYEVRKHFEDGPFAYFHAAGFGSIYPALNGMDAEGLVTCTEMAQDGRPDKKVYSITDAGRVAFRKALGKDPAEDKIRSESLLILFFAHLLDDERVEEVYQEYLEAHRGFVQCMEERCVPDGQPGRRFVHGLGMAIHKASVEYMEANRHLLFADKTMAESATEPVRMTGSDE
jgi:PadR family transcriptional regulator, regulatory protein AphA